MQLCSIPPIIYGIDMDQSSQEHYDLNSGDDDSFYEELKRQILLLTADDEKAREDYATVDHRRRISVSNKRNSWNKMGSYFDWTNNEKTSANSVPACIQSLWRNGNTGTGVFIPDIVMSRRRNKPRRRKNDRGRALAPENRMINI
ncbi:hypothetical protein ACET3Z_007307 [Daucus carota]